MRYNSSCVRGPQNTFSLTFLLSIIQLPLELFEEYVCVGILMIFCQRRYAYSVVAQI